MNLFDFKDPGSSGEALFQPRSRFLLSSRTDRRAHAGRQVTVST
ncbi:hypothetical protein [Streptomyces sp. NPDC048332]